MQRDINFFLVYRSPLESESGADKVKIFTLSLISVCLAVVLLLFALFKIQYANVLIQSKNMQQFISRSDVQLSQQKAAEDQRLVRLYESYYNKTESGVSDFKKLPVIGSKLLSGLASAMPGDVVVNKVTGADNVISIDCRCTDRLSAANFVHTLKQNSAFQSVTYNGISQINDKEYSFTVTFFIAEGGVK